MNNNKSKYTSDRLWPLYDEFMRKMSELIKRFCHDMGLRSSSRCIGESTGLNKDTIDSMMHGGMCQLFTLVKVLAYMLSYSDREVVISFFEKMGRRFYQSMSEACLV